MKTLNINETVKAKDFEVWCVYNEYTQENYEGSCEYEFKNPIAFFLVFENAVEYAKSMEENIGKWYAEEAEEEVGFGDRADFEEIKLEDLEVYYVHHKHTEEDNMEFCEYEFNEISKFFFNYRKAVEYKEKMKKENPCDEYYVEQVVFEDIDC